MKKAIIVLLLIIPLMLTSCTDNEEETTEIETHPLLEVTTAKEIPFSVMSPAVCEEKVPDYIKIKVSEVDFDAFEEISSSESVFPESGHDKILKSDNAQYFFVNDDIKIHGVFLDENDNITYVVSYNTETGYAEFVGNDSYSWYFDENGEPQCIVFTYKESGIAPVYTFYNPDGSKEVIRTMEGWYNTQLDMLSQDEVAFAVGKFMNTIEATAEY